MAKCIFSGHFSGKWISLFIFCRCDRSYKQTFRLSFCPGGLLSRSCSDQDWQQTNSTELQTVCCHSCISTLGIQVQVNHSLEIHKKISWSGAWLRRPTIWLPRDSPKVELHKSALWLHLEGDRWVLRCIPGLFSFFFLSCLFVLWPPGSYVKLFAQPWLTFKMTSSLNAKVKNWAQLRHFNVQWLGVARWGSDDFLWLCFLMMETCREVKIDWWHHRFPQSSLQIRLGKPLPVSPSLWLRKFYFYQNKQNISKFLNGKGETRLSPGS